MLQDNKSVRTALILVSLSFLGFALFANLPAIHKGFLLADQATYYAMAQSLAFDGDLKYAKKDLIRYYEDFNAGPNGIFLKRIKKDGQEKVFFAKNLAYPLFAAPFVRIFGANGPLVFHAVLLFLLLLMGFSYFSLVNSPGLSLLRVLTFLFASVAGVYFLWIAPDFFNLFLVFSVLFLWLYKVRYRDLGEPAKDAVKTCWQRFLLSAWSDYLAAFIAGIAVYSKPPNVALMGPFLLWSLLKKRYARSVGIVLGFAMSLSLLFGANVLLTSDWNYQGGERKSFYYTFPFEKSGATFDSAPSQEMTADGYAGRFLLPAKFVLDNAYYYVFGRFMGFAWYFFPAICLLLLFIRGRKSLDRWLILAALSGEILIYLIMMPDNFGGGGGSLANRYFLCIYPFFLYLAPHEAKRREIAVNWAAAAFLIGPILLTPFQSSAHPALDAQRFPFNLFPVEKTNINNLPTNVDPWNFRQQWGDPPFQDRFLYFLNENCNFPKHATENGWWTLGDRKADMILRTFFPVREVVFHLLNNPRQDNEITVTFEGKTERVLLEPSQRTDVHFSVGGGYRIKQAYQYRIKIKAAKGSIPYFESETSQERRLLGVFFELEVTAK
jgi:hypothetical protein